jgi:hypothetical protein
MSIRCLKCQQQYKTWNCVYRTFIIYLQHITKKYAIYLILNFIWRLPRVLMPQCIIFRELCCSLLSEGKHYFHDAMPAISRGKSPIMGRFPNMGRCIISHQEVLCSLHKNVNHQTDDTVLSNHCINGQLLRTLVLTGHLCFGALWNFCLSLNCDSCSLEGKLIFLISLVLSSLLSVILKTWFSSLVEF